MKFQEKNAKFIYAGNKEKEAYLQAFIGAQAILANPGASQQDVKDALQLKLKLPRKNFMGKNQRLQDVHNKQHCLISRQSYETTFSDCFYLHSNRNLL